MAGGYRTPRNGEMGRLRGENADLRKRVKELEKPGQAEKSSIRRAVVGATLPGGGYRGAVLAQNEDGKPVWSTPIGAIVPKYYIYLNSEGSDYDVNSFGPWTTEAAAKKMLPTPLFEYNQGAGGSDVTQMDWPISWGNEHQIWGAQPLMSDPMPIQLEIYVHPNFEGQKFEIQLPSSWMGSGGAPWFTVVVYNESAFYTADVELGMDNATYEGGVQRPWRMDYGVGEYFGWKVDNDYWTGSAQVKPFWWNTTDDEGRNIGFPVDRYYWREVRALEQDRPFSFTGDLSPVTGTSKLHNARNTCVRIGKVTASVGAAPTGGPIEIQALLHNPAGDIPLFLTPLTIPAGETYAEKVPDNPAASALMTQDWWVEWLSGEVAAVLAKGDHLTIDVVTVGVGDPGADLTVQAYYG